MSGRIYRLRRVCGNRACGNRVNRFTYGAYNEVAAAMSNVTYKGGDEHPKGIVVSFNSTDTLDSGTVRTRAIPIITELIKQRHPGADKEFSITTTSKNLNDKAIFEFTWKEGNRKGKNAETPTKWIKENILQKMAGDFIDGDPPTITSDGGVVSRNGIPIRVNYTLKKVKNPETGEEEEKPEAAAGDLDTPVDNTGGGDTYRGNGGGTGTGSSWTTWALIGGGVLLLVIVVAMFLKKKK